MTGNLPVKLEQSRQSDLRSASSSELRFTSATESVTGNRKHEEHMKKSHWRYLFLSCLTSDVSPSQMSSGERVHVQTWRRCKYLCIIGWFYDQSDSSVTCFCLFTLNKKFWIKRKKIRRLNKSVSVTSSCRVLLVSVMLHYPQFLVLTARSTSRSTKNRPESADEPEEFKWARTSDWSKQKSVISEYSRGRREKMWMKQ